MKRSYSQQIVMKDLSQFSKIYLVPLADLHIGCRESNLGKINGYINWIKERDNAFTILNGDLLNCATKDSSPELYEDLITTDDAYHQLRVILEPIKDKILAISRGGHEGQIFRSVGADYMARLAYDLEAPYKPEGGMVGVRLSKNGHTAVFFTYFTHGWGGARTIGAKVKNVDDLALVAEADCYVLSHDHTQVVHRLNKLCPPRSRLGLKNVYLQTHRQLLINTGGFINYSEYIQRKGYVPQDIGTPRIRMELKKSGKGYTKDLHASI